MGRWGSPGDPMGQQWVGGRANTSPGQGTQCNQDTAPTLSGHLPFCLPYPVPVVPPPNPGCPLPPTPHPLLLYFPRCLYHKCAPSQTVLVPGSFSLLSRSIPSGCQACQLPRKSSLWSEGPHGSPLHLSHPPGTAATRPSAGGSLRPLLFLQAPHQAPTDLGQDASSAPRFCT